jgi:mannosyltransferase OCH1-like enzyme
MNSDNPESGGRKDSRSEEMLQTHTIPKFLGCRTRASYPQQIPKTIWQTITRNVVPSRIRDWADTWIKLNPEYDYNLVDDDGMRGFIRSSFPEYLQAFNKTVHGASKADLWRYLVMFKYGGVYADIDCICLNPLRARIDPEAECDTVGSE